MLTFAINYSMVFGYLGLGGNWVMPAMAKNSFSRSEELFRKNLEREKE